MAATNAMADVPRIDLIIEFLPDDKTKPPHVAQTTLVSVSSCENSGQDHAVKWLSVENDALSNRGRSLRWIS
jgi:hypothetical protein